MIIPSNAVGNSFKRNTYGEQYLKGIMSKEEFNKVVDNLCKIAHNCHSKKRLFDNSKISQTVYFSFLIAFTCVFFFTILFYYGAVNQDITFKLASLILLAASMCLVAFQLVYTAIPTKILPSFEIMVNEEINNYFNRINKAYVTKGLWWRVVPGHYWVECRIDHTLKEDIQKIEEL